MKKYLILGVLIAALFSCDDDMSCEENSWSGTLISSVATEVELSIELTSDLSSGTMYFSGCSQDITFESINSFGEYEYSLDDPELVNCYASCQPRITFKEDNCTIDVFISCFLFNLLGTLEAS